MKPYTVWMDANHEFKPPVQAESPEDAAIAFAKVVRPTHEMLVFVSDAEDVTLQFRVMPATTYTVTPVIDVEKA